LGGFAAIEPQRDRLLLKFTVELFLRGLLSGTTGCFMVTSILSPLTRVRHFEAASQGNDELLNPNDERMPNDRIKAPSTKLQRSSKLQVGGSLVLCQL
jgi:hypothetical protein